MRRNEELHIEINRIRKDKKEKEINKRKENIRRKKQAGETK
jgi:hypothetical protein